MQIWESSVKATHLFLTEKEIKSIKQYVPLALQSIPRLKSRLQEDFVR